MNLRDLKIGGQITLSIEKEGLTKVMKGEFGGKGQA